MRNTIIAIITCSLLIGCNKAASTVLPKDTIDHRDNISECPVHNVDLIEETVSAVHMEIEPEASFEEARLRTFPHTGNSLVGINQVKIKNVIINYCPACRKANEMWPEEQQRKRNP